MLNEDELADDLSAGLAGLAGLLTGEQALEQTLVPVAQFAVRAVPGAQGAGLTLLEDGRARSARPGR